MTTDHAEQTVLADLVWTETVRCRTVTHIPARLLADPQGAAEWLADRDNLTATDDQREDTRGVSVNPVGAGADYFERKGFVLADLTGGVTPPGIDPGADAQGRETGAGC